MKRLTNLSSFFKDELAELKVEKLATFPIQGKKGLLQLDPVTTVNKLGEGRRALLRWRPCIYDLTPLQFS